MGLAQVIHQTAEFLGFAKKGIEIFDASVSAGTAKEFPGKGVWGTVIVDREVTKYQFATTPLATTAFDGSTSFGNDELIPLEYGPPRSYRIWISDLEGNVLDGELSPDDGREFLQRLAVLSQNGAPILSVDRGLEEFQRRGLRLSSRVEQAA